MPHGAEFVHVEAHAAIAQAPLHKENRAAVTQGDKGRDQPRQRQGDRRRHQHSGKIEQPLGLGVEQLARRQADMGDVKAGHIDPALPDLEKPHPGYDLDAAHIELVQLARAGGLRGIDQQLIEIAVFGGQRHTQSHGELGRARKVEHGDIIGQRLVKPHISVSHGGDGDRQGQRQAEIADPDPQRRQNSNGNAEHGGGQDRG